MSALRSTYSMCYSKPTWAKTEFVLQLFAYTLNTEFVRNPFTAFVVEICGQNRPDLQLCVQFTPFAKWTHSKLKKQPHYTKWQSDLLDPYDFMPCWNYGNTAIVCRDCILQCIGNSVRHSGTVIQLLQLCWL